MVGIKWSYYSSVSETAYEMTKHFLMCRVQWETARFTSPCRIQCGINNFFTIPKAEATLLLVEQVGEIYFNKEEKGLYTSIRKSPMEKK